MKTNHISILWFCLVIVLVGDFLFCDSVVYYINPETGDPSNPGTAAKPFKFISQAFQGPLPTNVTVILSKGVHTITSVLSVVNATNAASIYLIGAGTDSTTGTTVDCANDPYSVKFVGPFYIYITGILYKRCTGIPLHIDSANSVTINNTKFSGHNAATATQDGGAIYLRLVKNAVITDTSITTSSARYGGGLRILTSNVTIDNCDFDRNNATAYGGGLSISHSVNTDPMLVTITNSKFRRNNAGEGGGIYGGGVNPPNLSIVLDNILVRDNTDDDPTSTSNHGIGMSFRNACVRLSNSTVIDNRGINGSGGGIFFYGGCLLSIQNTRIRGNSNTKGGGLWMGTPPDTSATLEIIESSLTENDGIAVPGGIAIGGGIVSQANITITITNSTIANNKVSRGDAGAIYLPGSILTLRNSKIYSNQATRYAGGITCVSGGSLVLYNPSIYNNTIVDEATGSLVYEEDVTCNADCKVEIHPEYFGICGQRCERDVCSRCKEDYEDDDDEPECLRCDNDEPWATTCGDGSPCIIEEEVIPNQNGTGFTWQCGPSDNDKNTLIIAAVVGVVGGAIVLGALVGIVFIVRRRRSRKRRENSQVFAPSHSHSNSHSELALLPSYHPTSTITPSPSPSPHHSTISISPQSSKQRLPAAEELKLISSEIKDIQLKERLGGGHGGEVYRGIWGSTTEVALKSIKGENSSLFEKEVAVLQSCNFVHIIRYYGVFTKDEQKYIVMEFLSEGSAIDVLRKHGKNISQDDLFLMSIHTAAGMKYLEGKKIIHRDLSCRNLLVTKNSGKLVLKVADFGLSRLMHEDDQYYKTSQPKELPVKWSAPEAIKFGIFTSKSDSWSYGVCLWELFSRGMVPYYGMSNRETVDRLDEGYRLEQPGECPIPIYKLMLECWKTDPQERPTFEQIFDRVLKIQKAELANNAPLPTTSSKRQQRITLFEEDVYHATAENYNNSNSNAN